MGRKGWKRLQGRKRRERAIDRKSKDEKGSKKEKELTGGEKDSNRGETIAEITEVATNWQDEEEELFRD